MFSFLKWNLLASLKNILAYITADVLKLCPLLAQDLQKPFAERD